MRLKIKQIVNLADSEIIFFHSNLICYFYEQKLPYKKSKGRISWVVVENNKDKNLTIKRRPPVIYLCHISY